MNIAIRGYVGPVLKFEDRIEYDAQAELPGALVALAQRHAEQFANEPRHVIEIEFLDERDPLQRFLRFGTDPDGMVRPIPLTFKE